jgi:phosphatidylserine synthase
VSQLAAETTMRQRATPTHVPGSSFFALMAGLWGALVTLLVVSPTTLDDAHDWLRGLPIVWELLMWILTLPWTVAYLVYESSWVHWLRVLVVALIVVAHLSVSAPRTSR